MRRRLHISRSLEIYSEEKLDLLEREWTNFVFTALPFPKRASWRFGDLRRGLPYDDASFESAYANHVVEHLSAAEAPRFAAELYRVLEPGGIVRLTTPDLERAARYYVASLEEAAEGDDTAALRRYDWSVIELIDQMVRERSGGRMMEALQAGPLDPDEVRERLGDVALQFSRPKISRGQSARRLGVRGFGYAVARRLKRAMFRGDLRKLLESNRWMWDRVSLVRLLRDTGFVDSQVLDFSVSNIANWERYELDRSAGGDGPMEPSVYVEARRAS